MRDINVVVVSGTLQEDPVVRHLENGSDVLNVNIAVGRGWDSKKDADLGCWYFRLNVWGDTSKALAKAGKKGKVVMVHGELTFNSWTDQDGAKRSDHPILVKAFRILEDRPAPKPEQGSLMGGNRT